MRPWGPVAHDAIADARSICMRQYGDSPEVEVFGDASFTFAYVPGRGLHSSTSRLNVSTFCGIGAACRGCVGGV
jgi:hypothetical protein